MKSNRASSRDSHLDHRAEMGFRGSFGMVMRRPGPMNTLSSVACRRPVRLSKRGKCSTRNT